MFSINVLKKRWAKGVLALSLFALVLPLAGQDPTFSTDVKVVNVLATVRTKQGQIASNLTKDDFTLEEDGRPQAIKYFAKESDLPLTLGLLVDTSASQSRLLEEERDASYSFFDNVLRPDKDLAFLIHFDREVELLQDLTASRQKLKSALDLLRIPEEGGRGGYPGGGQRGGGGGGFPGSGLPGLPGGWPGSGPSTAPWPGSGPGPRDGGARRRVMIGGGTNLYDAVYLASSELMSKRSGRKALIILTDGVDTGSEISLNSAIESAERADALVYSILFVDPEMYQGGGGFGGRFPQQGYPDGRPVLDRISRESGGRLFEVSKKHSLGDIYAELQEELRNQYSIGYTPDRVGADRGYHRIRLASKQKDLTVQTRDGYYSQ